MDLETIFKEYKNHKLRLVQHIKSGKEADVYCVLDQETEQILALKVYRPNTHTSFHRFTPYLQGANIKSYYAKAIARKNKVGREYLEKFRTRQEFKLLQKFYKEQAFIPEPLSYSQNSILMQYIGLETPALRLIEVELDLDSDLAKSLFENIVKTMQIFIDNFIIHGDLSPFNILVFNDLPYVIDFPQSMDMRENPAWKEFLERDIKNMENYFKRKITLKIPEI